MENGREEVSRVLHVLVGLGGGKAYFAATPGRNVIVHRWTKAESFIKLFIEVESKGDAMCHHIVCSSRTDTTQ